MRFVYYVTTALVLLSSVALTQPKYRSFPQGQLSERIDRYAGRSIASKVSFVVKNTFDTPKNVISAHVSSPIISLEDSGGFPSLKLMNYKTTIVAEGKVLQPGDSVVFTAMVKRTVRGTKITGYQMRWKDTATTAFNKRQNQKAMMPGAGVTTITITHGFTSKAILASSDNQIYAQPTGGNVLEYLYRAAVKKPAGIVLGVAKTQGRGWVRMQRSDMQSFPHTGTPRCLDTFLVSKTKKLFSGELKSPTVRVHNNQLLGALHALKLSIIANSSGMAMQDDAATPFNMLIYYDSANTSDPYNNMTIQQISNLGDTMLTFCNRYTAGEYQALNVCVNRILTAFSGTIEVTSMKPMYVVGARSLDETEVLHSNPAAGTVAQQRNAGVDLDNTDNFPTENSLMANYPNPFNPTTNISFVLNANSVVTLKVYNLLGQEVSSLLDRSDLLAGEHNVEFDASNLSSGTYYYRFTATNLENGAVFSDVKKMALVK